MFLFLLFFVTSVLASPVRIQTYSGRFGNPCITATVRNHSTNPMRIAFGSSSIITCQGARFADVGVVTESGGLLSSILNESDNVIGGRASFESFIAIGTGSHLRNSFGPISVLQNDRLVLNSSHAEFVSSCVAGSYIAIPLIDERFDGTIQSEGQTYNVTFELGLSPSGKLVAVPSEIASNVRTQMASMGAVGLFRGNFRGVREFVMTNCTSAIIESLPDINLEFANIGSIILSPQDYVFADDANRECFLGFHNPLPDREGGYCTLNPIEIPGANVRVSDDLLEICDSA